MADVVQFNLRIPAQLKKNIADASQKSGRSINAEAQMRLENSFKGGQGNISKALEELKVLVINHSPSHRLDCISKKLNFLLKEASLVKLNESTPPPSISRLAMELNYQVACEVEKWFNGFSEPSFNELKLLSRYFGCNENWLLYDEGKPFIRKRFSFDYDIKVNAKYLTTGTGDTSVDSLWFIRNQSNNGEVLIVKILNRWQAQLITTRVYISNNIEPKDIERSALMVLTLRHIYEYSKTNVFGALVSERQFNRFFLAEENPVKLVQELKKNKWVDCIHQPLEVCDQDNRFWDGWHETCALNAAYIKQKNLQG